MTSPIVFRLNSKIEACSDNETKYSLLGDLACYWARVGSFDEAERLRLEIRREFGDGRSLAVSVRVMCAEGLLLYYKDLSPAARDRFARAYLLSKAAKDSYLTALTSSWLAHIDFNLSRFDAMTVELGDCFANMDADDGAAECRASLVLGDAFLYSGDLPSSQRWYERARQVASRIGDQAAVGAMTYNRAALRVLGARLDSLSGPVASGDLSLIAMEVESAINYQAVASLLSLDHLLKSAKAGVLLLQERYIEAEPIVRGLLQSSDVPAESAQQAILAADLTRLLSETGREAEALDRLRTTSGAAKAAHGDDDMAIIFSSLAAAAERCGESAMALGHRQDASDALARHLGLMRDLASGIAQFRIN